MCVCVLRIEWSEKSCMRESVWVCSGERKGLWNIVCVCVLERLHVCVCVCVLELMKYEKGYSSKTRSLTLGRGKGERKNVWCMYGGGGVGKGSLVQTGVLDSLSTYAIMSSLSFISATLLPSPPPPPSWGSPLCRCQKSKPKRASWDYAWTEAMNNYATNPHLKLTCNRPMGYVSFRLTGLVLRLSQSFAFCSHTHQWLKSQGHHWWEREEKYF